MNELIEDLIDTCSVHEHDEETVYTPVGSPSDEIVSRRLDFCQAGAYFFHKALKRLGKAQVHGDA